ncbi:hypothetical protein [Aureibacter tunicatorum]|uniref:ParB/Sulfiredoxin domain-containing protein n=1 Tax=Aureibacter tunicatorum TaxID=866807 RepID=A0AAE3XMN5_9BACT|nr:hypothetical protein [Aureibacter tunicatorum]MDR6240726.1 hypothetical protein [Aureibacter tunicatorum]BDD06941.1 hypothetical protein AUTU_44240 [Aureibacter tunicatorum]
MAKRGTFSINTKKKLRANSNVIKQFDQQLKVLEELKQFIPTPTDEERAQLEENIRKEGVRDPLVIWKRDDDQVLIDGHNRYSIIQKLKSEGVDQDFKLKILPFENIEEVKDWMILNQLGRRNLTPEQSSELRGLYYEREKKKPGGTGANQYTELRGQNDPEAKKTAEKLAEKLNVSAKTIKRDEQFAKGLRKIAESNPQMKQDILQRKVKVNKTDVQKLSKVEGALKIDKVDDIKSVVEKKPTEDLSVEVKEEFLVRKGMVQQLRDSLIPLYNQEEISSSQIEKFKKTARTLLAYLD